MKTKEQDMNLNLEKVKEAHVSIKITTLVLMLIFLWKGTLVVNAQYVHWHDTRYAKRTEIITLAQAEELKADAQATKKLAQENSKKLTEISAAQMQLSMDFSTYAASTLVSQAKTALRNHLQNEQDHVDRTRWLEDKAKLEAQLQKAEEYRSCVIGSKSNCGRFLLTPN